MVHLDDIQRGFVQHLGGWRGFVVEPTSSVDETWVELKPAESGAVQGIRWVAHVPSSLPLPLSLSLSLPTSLSSLPLPIFLPKKNHQLKFRLIRLDKKKKQEEEEKDNEERERVIN